MENKQQYHVLHVWRGFVSNFFKLKRKVFVSETSSEVRQVWVTSEVVQSFRLVSFSTAAQTTVTEIPQHKVCSSNQILHVVTHTGNRARMILQYQIHIE